MIAIGLAGTFGSPKTQPKTEFLVEFTNHEDGVTGVVFKSRNKCGGYAAQLRDDDSGEFLTGSRHGISFKSACELARKWANLPEYQE